MKARENINGVYLLHHRGNRWSSPIDIHCGRSGLVVWVSRLPYREACTVPRARNQHDQKTPPLVQLHAKKDETIFSMRFVQGLELCGSLSDLEHTSIAQKLHQT